MVPRPDQMEPNHAQFPGPQLELYSELKARLPENAQRINSLLASDKAFASINMSSKFVTLETSKLSGWLNAFAILNIYRQSRFAAAEVATSEVLWYSTQRVATTVHATGTASQCV